MTKKQQTTVPSQLEARFHPPPGWQWRTFKNEKGRRLRYGYVLPEKENAVALVVGLQGLSEFSEKYFETARTLLDHNMGFCMMDWQGQGKSQRHLDNTPVRHSSGFDEDVADLHLLITNHIKSTALHPDAKTLPLVMLAHSMGANIGLRYLHRHPDSFIAAGLTAPLLAIKALPPLPKPLALALTYLLHAVLNKTHILGTGGPAWSPHKREINEEGALSSDPVRRTIHNIWCRHDPELQVGNVTYGWLHAANSSCALLQKKNVIEDITTPCLLALAGRESLVDNNVTRKIINHFPQAELLELPASYHEIIMETDEIRDVFFQHFFKLVKTQITGP